ncbi:hypothetical protein [Streptomyces graminilatus]|uniref:hypothetical protein n=1 Tax=Streptomyces graminilatus TaxID=1464070 RepID=UPI0006E2621B|nr:hypothetical protein [Streptomyces graminilatus]
MTVDIPGVVHQKYDGPGGDLDLARHRRDALLAEGVSFPTARPGTLPWLMALKPFTMDRSLTAKVAALGTAVFAYIDAVQDLYAQRHPVVRAHLDPGTEPDLRGLDLHRRIQTFRLDLVVEQGSPVITEIEEIYGNAGKAHAMQSAYGVSYEGLFQSFANLGLSHVLVDDQVRTYDSELAIVRRRLRTAYGQDLAVQFFSEAKLKEVKAAWRFCYTLDFGQYDIDRRAAITQSGIAFANPLFHGYGTKALTALAFHPDLTPDLEGMLGAATLGTLRSGIAESRLLTGTEDVPALAEQRKGLVIKVTDSPAQRAATWGSRGVYFGESSRAKWESVLDAVRGGHLPGRPSLPAAYLLSRLIDSDRFDIAFLHPDGDRLGVMPRARMRLAPIFFRQAGRVELVAGHATFVNTSRKVHLGQHAVCAPLDWWRGGGRKHAGSDSFA